MDLLAHIRRAAESNAQAIRTAGEKACIVLGMAERVAEIIGDLQLTELDRIAERRHRHLEPRWADRPAVWRSLLSVASAREGAETKRVDAYGLQLLTGDLMPITKVSRRADLRRPHTVSPPPEGLNGHRRSTIPTISSWPRPFPYRAAYGTAESAHSTAIIASA